MTFAFIAKHRGIWPAGWLCEALGVSRGGFYAWRTRSPSARAKANEQLLVRVRTSFLASDRTYGARRVWHDLLADGISCGRHRIERLMRHAALRARPRRRGLPLDTGVRSTHAVAPNVLNRTFDAASANRKWVADFTYLWTAEGWLCVAASDCRSAQCNQTRRPWPGFACGTFWPPCVQSSTRRRSSPSPHCPRRCRLGSCCR